MKSKLLNRDAPWDMMISDMPTFCRADGTGVSWRVKCQASLPALYDVRDVPIPCKLLNKRRGTTSRFHAMMSRLAKDRWPLVGVVCGIFFAPSWTSAQNLSNNQLQQVVARLADGATHRSVCARDRISFHVHTH